MVAVEDRVHEGAVDRAAVLGAELRQLLGPLGQRRAAFAGPHHGVEREPLDAFRMALREHGAQRARRDAVDQERPGSACLQDVVGGGREVVGAVGDVAVDVASCRSGRSPPCRRTRCRSRAPRTSPWPTIRGGPPPAGRRSAATPSRSRARTGSCRRRPARRPLLPQEQAHVALVGPVFVAARHRWLIPACSYCLLLLAGCRAAEHAALRWRRCRRHSLSPAAKMLPDGSARAASGRTRAGAIFTDATEESVVGDGGRSAAATRFDALRRIFSGRITRSTASPATCRHATERRDANPPDFDAADAAWRASPCRAPGSPGP